MSIKNKTFPTFQTATLTHFKCLQNKCSRILFIFKFCVGLRNNKYIY